MHGNGSIPFVVVWWTQSSTMPCLIHHDLTSTSTNLSYSLINLRCSSYIEKVWFSQPLALLFILFFFFQWEMCCQSWNKSGIREGSPKLTTITPNLLDVYLLTFQFPRQRDWLHHSFCRSKLWLLYGNFILTSFLLLLINLTRKKNMQSTWINLASRRILRS